MHKRLLHCRNPREGGRERLVARLFSSVFCPVAIVYLENEFCRSDRLVATTAIFVFGDAPQGRVNYFLDNASI